MTYEFIRAFSSLRGENSSQNVRGLGKRKDKRSWKLNGVLSSIDIFLICTLPTLTNLMSTNSKQTRYLIKAAKALVGIHRT